MREICTTEQACLTNQMSELYVRLHLSELTKLHAPVLMYYAAHYILSLVGCLASSHAIGSKRDSGLAEVSVV
uniref:Cyclin N-terminal domain-containing protein n=1 Tax=Mesocestoides corti TaxID=53468 RepID=A0A5K3FBI9_MESCO